MDGKVYRWTKTYVVTAPSDDTTQPGDFILVKSQGSTSKQLVLSVTEKKSKSGSPYHVLLVEAVQ